MNRILDIALLTIGAILITFAAMGLFNLQIDPRVMFLIVLGVAGIAFVSIGMLNIFYSTTKQ
jgi:hypothetical protein